MTNIFWVFGSLETALLIGCVLAVVWGLFRNWEMELLLPPMVGFCGTLFLSVCFFASTCGFYWAQ